MANPFALWAAKLTLGGASRGRWARYACGWLLWGAPIWIELCSGSWQRFTRFHGADWGAFFLYLPASLFFWGGLVALKAPSPKGVRHRWPLLLVLGMLTTVQTLLWSQYSAVLSPGLLEQGAQHWSDLSRTVHSAGGTYVRTLLLPLGLLMGLAYWAEAPPPLQKFRHRHGRWGLSALPLLPLILWAPFSSAKTNKPADLQQLQSLWGFSQRWSAGNLGSLEAQSAVPWVPPASGNDVNVLFILSESLRYDSYCSDPAEPCSVTPAIHRLLPDRTPLRAMHSLDSWTIMSVAAMTTGLGVQTPRPELEAAPNLLEYARAGGRHTEFMGSQRLKLLFLRTAGAHYAQGFDELSSDPNDAFADELLRKRALERIGKSGAPWFTFLQFGDTHTPYSVDPQDAPFTPYEQDFSWDGTAKLRNQYLNAIHRQDKIIAALLEELRRTGKLDRTVIFFTADHGESFREQSQLFHGGSLRNEETHVPAWVWVPPALRRELGARFDALQAAGNRTATHLDLLPTVLDVMGLWGEPSWERTLQPLKGHSLLTPISAPAGDSAPASSSPLLAMSNCGPLMDCAFKTWGVIQGNYQIEAKEWDGYWNCWELFPGQKLPRSAAMGEAPCQQLLRGARPLFPTLPNGNPF